MIRRAGWKDGMPGVIDGFYQPFGLFCSRVMLWELQQRGRIDEAYAELEHLVEQQVSRLMTRCSLRRWRA